MKKEQERRPRQDVSKLVKRLDLAKNEIILDLAAGDGSQIKQLRAMGYLYTFGVDLVENQPFVQGGDMREFVQRDFQKPISLIYCRYALHLISLESAKVMFSDIYEILRERGYLYIVAFNKNDPVIPMGHSVDELVALIPKGMRIVEISQEIQEDKDPYCHEHQIIKVVLQKEKKNG